MAHVPETVERYVCTNCHVVHAGTPVHEDVGDHSFHTPSNCGACGADAFVELGDWIRFHD